MEGSAERVVLMPATAEMARESLEELLHELAGSRKGKQAIIAVDAPKQSLHWIGAVGQTMAAESVTSTTPYFIASIDKLYNATISMMLAERGDLDLDQSICNYLPESLTRGLHQYGGRDLTAEITVRHLLTHTSGLPDWFEDYPKGGSNLSGIVFEEGDRTLTVEELIRHVRDHLRPHFPPQDLARRGRIRYSDTNFILVAAIIEFVTGLPLHEAHTRMLYKPFNLCQTYFLDQSQSLVPTSSPMILRANGVPLHIPLLIQSVKGIYSTAADQMKFIRLLMKGEPFDRPETLPAMMSNWRRFGFPTDRAALRSPNWPIEYAIGMMRFHVPRLFTPFTPIPALYGHTGSTGCWLFYCPDLDIAMSGSVEDAAAGAVPFGTAPRILRILSKS